MEHALDGCDTISCVILQALGEECFPNVSMYLDIWDIIWSAQVSATYSISPEVCVHHWKISDAVIFILECTGIRIVHSLITKRFRNKWAIRIWMTWLKAILFLISIFRSEHITIDQHWWNQRSSSICLPWHFCMSRDISRVRVQSACRRWWNYVLHRGCRL